MLLGASGMVGRSVLQYLEETGASTRIHALVRPGNPAIESSNVKTFFGDMEHLPKGLVPEGRHVIVHYASKQRDTDGSGYQVNLKGLQNLCRRLNSNTAGVIYGSSASVYGQGNQYDITEAAFLNPQTELAKMRLLCEKELMIQACRQHFTLYLLRPRFMIGPGDRYIVPYLQKQADKRLCCGMGSQRYSFISTCDYAQIIVKLGEKAWERSLNRDPAVKALNVGYREGVCIKDVEELLQKGRRGKIRIPAGLMVFLYGTMFHDTDRKTKAELFGYSHYLNVGALEEEIGCEITSKDSRKVFKEAALRKEGDVWKNPLSYLEMR